MSARSEVTPLGAKKYQRTRHTLTIDVARDLISYEPETGIFRWKKNRNGLTVVAGSPAGAFDRLGYKRIFILGKSYQAAQLAYFLTNGVWPTAHMDHINGVRDDDRWENLRPATISQNGINKTISSRNTTGAKGVTQYSKNFVARIKVDKKTISIGSYPTLDEAAHAYNKAAIKHFGEFAVLNPIGQDSAMEHENCLACGGSGEKSGDGILDCIACDAADKRVALNAYMHSMKHLCGSDRDWAIFQYAQKQTAAVSAAPSGEVERDAARYRWLRAHAGIKPTTAEIVASDPLSWTDTAVDSMMKEGE